MAHPLLLLLGLAAAGAAVSSSKKKAGGATAPHYGPAGAPFSNGMASDANTPPDTVEAVNAALSMVPTDAASYQETVNAITRMAAMLRQNYPRASDALWARYSELRGTALASGWRQPDGLDR